MDRIIRYEEEVATSKAIILRILTRLNSASSSSSSSSEDVSRLLIEMDAEMAVAMGYVSSMDLEINDLGPTEKRSMMPRVKAAKDSLKELRDILIVGSSSTAKEAPSSSSSAPVPLPSSLDRATHMLERSRQLVADTERVGAHVTGDLECQREKLLGAQHHVLQMRASATIAKQTLSSIGSRAFTLKVFLVFLNILLSLLIGMLLYYGSIKGKFTG